MSFTSVVKTLNYRIGIGICYRVIMNPHSRDCLEKGTDMSIVHASRGQAQFCFQVVLNQSQEIIARTR